MNKIEKLASKYIYWPELENPFQKNINFAENSVKNFTADVLSKNVAKPKVNIDKEILEFYALNQFLSQQRMKDGNVLDEKLVDIYKEYKNKIDDLSQKMFSYIFTVTLMEARHCLEFKEQADDIENELDDKVSDYESQNDYKTPSASLQKQWKLEIKDGYKDRALAKYKRTCPSGFFPKFVKSYNFLSKFFTESNPDYGRNTVIKKVVPVLKTLDIPLEDFMKTISVIFDYNNFDSGYGGYAWEKITEHGLKFAKGEMNAEVFVDQAFSLEHNGGCLFNKDVIFNEMSNTNFSTTSKPNQKNKYYNNSNSIRLKKSQFLLNMQHEGEILNFLSLSNFSMEEIEEVVDSMDFDQNAISGFSTRPSINTFFSDVLDEVANYSNSPIVKKLLKLQKKSSSTIDFKSFLSYEIDRDGDKSPVLNSTQKQTLDIAKRVSTALSKPITLAKIYNKKDVFFEVIDTAKVPAKMQNKEILGRKAFGLSEMNKLNLPVPKAVVWTCENSKSYSQFPKQWLKTLKSQMNGINSYNKNKDGKDVMCSIRSGAPVSMPGMMDTILNVGIDDSNYHDFVEKIGKSTTDQCAIRFMKIFTKSYFDMDIKWPKNINAALQKFNSILKKYDIKVGAGMFPLSKSKQIEMSLEAVFKSWNCDRAIDYRNHHDLDHSMGTAAIMQHMVFGNLNAKSCTGVLFSRDCINGEEGIIGEFLVNGQGEEVVAGEVTPTNIREMKKWDLKAYNKLAEIALQLEEKTGQIQDIEFTIEDGEVYILQCRTAVSSPEAKMKLLHEKLDKKKINFSQFLTHLDHNSISTQEIVDTKSIPEFKGMSANPGVIKGICIKNEKDIEKFTSKAEKENLKFILISEETKPDHAGLMIKSDAFLTQRGGFTSHAAILARSWGKPCIVGSQDSKALKPGEVITMDAKTGQVWRGVQNIITKKDNKIIKNLVTAHVNLDSFARIKNKETEKINNQKTWMSFGPHTKEIKPKTKTFNKFLDMGELAVIKLSVAAKKETSISMSHQ